MDSSNQPVVSVNDPILKGLLNQWRTELNLERKERIKQAIIVIVEMQERNTFLTRFILKDFESWNNVLTKEESDSGQAHKADFYEPHLIAVLKENGGKLAPLQVIQQILIRVIKDLTVADFALTPSKRFRYDTTIRFLADSMKKRKVLSVNEESQNKYWMLSEYATDTVNH